MREAIHVGNQTFSDGADVEKYLREDTLQSVKPWLAEVMDHYKVSRGRGGGEEGPAQNSWATVSQGDFFLVPILLLPFKNTSSIYSRYKIEITFFILLLWIVLFIVS